MINREFYEAIKEKSVDRLCDMLFTLGMKYDTSEGDDSEKILVQAITIKQVIADKVSGLI